jgi:sucrose-6-phosphate hydrolase SacC (GH32 family)
MRYALLLIASFHAALAAQPDIVLSTFEDKKFDDWTPSGDAFASALFQSGDSGRFTKFEGATIVWSGRSGLDKIGTLLSPEFEIQRGFINYLAAGMRDLPSKVGVELLVGDRVVRSASASDAKDETHALYWRTFDVHEFAGRKARLRVNDQNTLGAIAVDQFIQSDEAKGLPVDATVFGQESLRPQFHFTAATGWQNDANGLTYYKGQWHLFHQHRPPDHPAIVWGHATSPDLLHWQRLPAAIKLPDTAASGSGVVDWTNASGLQRGDDPPLLLFYTLHPGDKTTQCLAFSNDGGRTFEQFAGNPILRTPATRDRDPKVLYDAPSKAWFMALSLSRNNEHRDQATYGIFRSTDLKSWKLLNELGPGAWYWECPDLFQLPVDGDPSKMKWVFTKGSGDYLLGTLDDSGFKPETEPIRTQWGGNFYGGQTFADAPNGRRVHIAWMSTGKDGPNSWPGMPFNQQMSFPRELSLRTTSQGPRLFREPIAEIAQLYTKTREIPPRDLAPGDNALGGIDRELLDLDFEIDLQQAKQIVLNLRGTEIVYDAKEQKLKVLGRAIALTPLNGKLVLRALLDRTSIELFANHGEVTHSIAFFPAATERRLVLAAQGGTAHLAKLTVHELKPALPQSAP